METIGVTLVVALSTLVLSAIGLRWRMQGDYTQDLERRLRDKTNEEKEAQRRLRDCLNEKSQIERERNEAWNDLHDLRRKRGNR